MIGMSESALVEYLRTPFPAPEFVVVPQVRSKAGFGASRTADAIAVGLWPSRGFHIHGFEIKSNRTDFLRELKNPAKAETVAAYCDFWHLVISDPSIAAMDEVPTNWGLFVLENDKLRRKKSAVQLQDVKPLTRSFLSALLRNAVSVAVDDRAIQVAVSKETKKLSSDFEKRFAAKESTWLREKQRLENEIREFEKLTGLNRWSVNHATTSEFRTAFDSFRELLKMPDNIDHHLNKITCLLREGVEHEKTFLSHIQGARSALKAMDNAVPPGDEPERRVSEG